MHELSLIQNTLALARQQLKQAGAQRIHVLRLRIGALSGVSMDALEFAFDVVRRDSPAADARLEIEPVATVCWCARCNAEFQPQGYVFECPTCHELSSDVRHGRELELVSVEVS